MFGSALIESRSLLRCSPRLALSINRTNVLATCIILGCSIIFFEFLLGIPATETVASFWCSCACIHNRSFGKGPHLSCGRRMLWGLLESSKTYSDRAYRHNRHIFENNSQPKLLRSFTNPRQIGPWRFASGWHAMTYECHLNHSQWSKYSKVLSTLKPYKARANRCFAQTRNLCSCFNAFRVLVKGPSLTPRVSLTLIVFTISGKGAIRAACVWVLESDHFTSPIILSSENSGWFVLLAAIRVNESLLMGKSLGSCLIVASIIIVSVVYEDIDNRVCRPTVERWPPKA